MLFITGRYYFLCGDIDAWYDVHVVLTLFCFCKILVCKWVNYYKVCILEYKRLSIQILKKKGGSLIKMYIYIWKEKWEDMQQGGARVYEKERRRFLAFLRGLMRKLFFVRIKTMDRKVLSFKNQDHGKMLANKGKPLFDLVIKVRFNRFGFFEWLNFIPWLGVWLLKEWYYIRK